MAAALLLCYDPAATLLCALHGLARGAVALRVHERGVKTRRVRTLLYTASVSYATTALTLAGPKFVPVMMTG